MSREGSNGGEGQGTELRGQWGDGVLLTLDENQWVTRGERRGPNGREPRTDSLKG